MAPTPREEKEGGLPIVVCCLIGLSIYLFPFGLLWWLDEQTPVRAVPEIEVASMDFTIHNITQTHLSATWDLLTRIPSRLPDNYICLQGDLQASLFYKNITIAISSRHRYENLKRNSPQQLRVSASIYEEDISGLVGKNIITDIKEKMEVKFGSQLFLTDCREKSTGVMRYACDETTLRFEPGSETKATSFGNKNNPTCVNF
ncbi:F202 protein [Hirschfeldia incana]|nr:F202 protein [Hirschfeldia incana]